MQTATRYTYFAGTIPARSLVTAYNPHLDALESYVSATARPYSIEECVVRWDSIALASGGWNPNAIE